MDLISPEKQFALFLDDVRLPADALVGAEDAGLLQLFAGLNPERIMVAAFAIGIARYALGKASAYVKDAAGVEPPIGAHQGVAHPLAQAKIQLELARLMMQKAAALYDAGDDLDAGEAANMAKYAAGEACGPGRRHGGPVARRQRHDDRVRRRHAGRGRPGGPDRAGQPGDDPQLRRPAQPWACPSRTEV